MIAGLLDWAPAWMLTHAAALIVVTPLAGAGVCAFLTSGRLAWLVTLGATLASTVFAFVLWAQVGAVGVVSYAMGGWEPPIGIEVRIDGLNIVVLLLVCLMAVAASVFAATRTSEAGEPQSRSLFFSAFLLCFAGLLGVAATGDAFNLFVFLEISSLSTYVLVAEGARRDRRALTASYNYLIFGTIGATFYVIGVGFLYMATGSLNMADIANILSGQDDSTVVRAGFAFIVIGLGLKAAMYPLHSWLPGAYAFAPSVVSLFLAATATKVAIYALVRFLFMVFDPSQGFQVLSLTWLIGPLAAAAMVIASIQAVLQADAKRVLAYSSVAQVGYILLGVAMATTLGMTAGLLHLLNHALMKGALFAALGLVAMRISARRVRDLAGLGAVMPITAGAFAVGGLSLIGVPLTAGFVSKFALLTAAAEAGWWWGVAVIAVSSVLAFVYVGRILEAMYLRAPSEALQSACAGKRAPVFALSAMLILAAANIWFGVDARAPEHLAIRAADVLFDVRRDDAPSHSDTESDHGAPAIGGGGLE